MRLKILVTGGAGFIGSHLVDKLLSENHEVGVLENLYSGNSQNLRKHEENPSFRFFEGDIRNEEDVEKALNDTEAVFHEAAITSVPVSMERPDFTEEVNVQGTVTLLEKCEELGVEKLVYASTCAIYGDTENLPVSEDCSPKFRSPYAKSKFLGEEKCREFEEKGDLETVILRYFNVYGPGRGEDGEGGVIYKFLKRLDKEKSPVIYGDGNQTRDFVYVKDVVRANILALEKKGISGQAFNIGSGRAISINELLDTLLDLTGMYDLEPIHREPRSGDIRHSRADLSKAAEKLNYTPDVSLKEGLRRLVEEEWNF
ncbi:hypothetical protein AKJ64_02885 [candidate division MSBL1 archaeon SCGC-AAA259E17]|uniref:NAD-dependent epimerase/dehydratase domain-containing protein n=1 Tax=candidate division MSBL1 archaeon SCGC-AAA259E17 TaxID=1698263 RepID=A0A133UEC8_9EURY|nr:hypothetical protein AKJ64_02885 [candidate division MSBL1 archaeon SCGC-AAA259E17]